MVLYIGTIPKKYEMISSHTLCLFSWQEQMCMYIQGPPQQGKQILLDWAVNNSISSFAHGINNNRKVQKQWDSYCLLSHLNLAWVTWHVEYVGEKSLLLTYFHHQGSEMCHALFNNT